MEATLDGGERWREGDQAVSRVWVCWVALGKLPDLSGLHSCVCHTSSMLGSASWSTRKKRRRWAKVLGTALNELSTQDLEAILYHRHPRHCAAH